MAPITPMIGNDSTLHYCPSMSHDFIMPNGIILTAASDPDMKLSCLKKQLWNLASEEPFFELLGPMEDYFFQGISTAAADEEDFYDEQRTLASLQLMLPLMRLEKVADDAQVVEENKRNAMIAKISAISQADLKAAEVINPEVSWARKHILSIAQRNLDLLKSGGPVAMAQYLTAATQQPKLTVSLQRSLQDLPYLTISAVYIDCSTPPQQHILTLALPKEATVAMALSRIIEPHDSGDELLHTKYLLKVCCSQEYLFDPESLIIHYTYVQECLERSEIPRLTPVLLEDVLDCLNLPPTPNQSSASPPSKPPTLDQIPSYIELAKLENQEAVEGGEMCLWDLRDCFAVTVRNVQKMVTPETTTTTSDKKTATASNSAASITMVDPMSEHNGISASSSSTELDSTESVSTTATTPDTNQQQQSPTSMDTLTATTGGSQFPSKYMVRVGLAHGGQLLSEYQNTREPSVSSGTSYVWNQPLNFRMVYSDLPLATRVCVILLQVKRRPGRMMEFPVGWANMNLFDHNGCLVRGRRLLPLWRSNFPNPETATPHQLNLSGTVAENPDPEFTILLDFCHSSDREGRIRFPISRFVSTIRGSNSNSSSSLEASESDHLIIRGLLNRDPFYELSEQDKAALWRARETCCRRLYPTTSLPWLVQAVTWERHDMVEEFYRLLAAWPRPLPVETCLQLLGVSGLSGGGSSASSGGGGGDFGSTTASASSSSFDGSLGRTTGVADPLVRDIAVQGLGEGLSNADLADYLLQLVQVVRTEAYLVTALTCFLLQRALACPTLIGVRLCWHLRAQIHNPDARLRFGFMLDAFCRGCGPSLLIFIHEQTTALHRLTDLAISVKRLPEDEEQRAWFMSELVRTEVRQDLETILSPLRLSIKLGSICRQECTVKRSKKRPLWLVWKNPDNLGLFHHKTHQLLFKHGDDLRQDMLTLQLLKVMDRIWKDEGFNLDLTTYGCLATGSEMGLIEVVRNSQTIMSIQGQRVRSAMQIDSSQLHKWFLQKKAPPHGSEAAYEAAIRRFTNSCAGYCVATFVLGIRDRHNDNIMVDNSGRLFHIDFGHILNNKKKKFGITRERVPFVLTSDFACVIARGEEKPYRSQGFIDFTNLCGNAYRVLRRHSNLLLTLLAMMLPSGLPELTCVNDLEYVRKTLAVESQDEVAALNYFNAKFNEAYNGAWTTKIDWFAHWVRR